MSKLFPIDVISIRHKRTHILYLVRNAPCYVLFSFFFRNIVSPGRIDAIVIMPAIKANPSLLSFPFFSRLSDVFGFKFLRSNRTRELFGQRLRLFVFRGYEGKFPDTLLNPFVVLRPM